jgi:hypothetical protein
MKNSKIERIKALNLTEDEVITLEKAKDRKELEMISMITDVLKGENSNENMCFINCSCKGTNCDTFTCSSDCNTYCGADHPCGSDCFLLACPSKGLA